MRFSLTAEQVLFRETTLRFLGDVMPAAAVRRLRHEPNGFERGYWRLGAELGWTSLLVDEHHGGGTISGDGLADLALVADAFGRHAAPGPLIDTNLVASALSRAGDRHSEIVADLISGTATASWCHGDAPSLDIERDGDHVVLRGSVRPVESATQATWLLATGRGDDGLSQVLVGTDVPGVSCTPMHTVDLTRRFFAVAFDDVRVPIVQVVGELGAARDEVDHQLRLAVVLSCAEAAAAMQAAFDMTLEWAHDRYSFGRPLASYQALKHRFADMKSWLEASHAITDAAIAAVSARTPEAAELASAAKAFVGTYGSELLHDCVQLHGGIGVTFEYDLHLLLRRHTVDRGLYGTPDVHRQRLCDLLEHRGAAA